MLLADVMPDPTVIPMTDFGGALLKMLTALFIIILMLLGTYFILKKLIGKKSFRQASEQTIQILEKKMLSPKTMLYLIEFEGKKVLLAESQLEIKELATKDKEAITSFAVRSNSSSE